MLAGFEEFAKTPQPIGGKQAFETGTSLALGFGPGAIGNAAEAMGVQPFRLFGGVKPTAGTPTQQSQLIEDFDKTGVRPDVPTVSQGRFTGVASQLSRLLPASPVQAGMRARLSETEAAAQRHAQQFGTAQTPEAAGAEAANALRRYAEDRRQAQQDYGEFYRQMAGAKPAPMPNTLDAVKSIMGRYPNAPELSGLFTSEPIKKLAAVLPPRTKTIPAVTSPVLSASGLPIVTSPARTVTTGGVLSMPEIEELRSQVGAQLRGATFGPTTIPKGELNRLYGAITKDMMMAAKQQGPDALKALRGAIYNYGTRSHTIRDLRPLIMQGDRELPPKTTFDRLNAAASDQRADTNVLLKAKAIMQPWEWGDFGASVLKKIGEPTAGARDILQPNFSVSTYATNWNKITPKAKDLLFGPNAPGSPRDGLESLARVVNAQKNVGRLANTSHSGEMVAVGRVLEGVIAAVVAGHFPVATAGGVAGAYAGAKLLMSPGFTRWMYGLPQIVKRAKTMEEAKRAAMQSLQRAMKAGAPSVAPKQDRAATYGAPSMSLY